MDKIYTYIQGHTKRAIALLERLCRQPSISAQGVGLEEMAELVATAMREYSLTAELWPTDGGPPLVYGDIQGRSPHTLLFYNHYDVQPVDPLDEWTSPPFEPTRRDDKLFARGVSDNKGDLVVRLEAIAALREVMGELPLSIKFVVDGEEESGSLYFPQAVRTHKSRLAADVCLSEGSGLGPNRTPSLVLGVKGMLYVELSAQMAQVDAHSAYAAVVPNPSWRLVGALDTLKHPDGRVAIEGFYDAVRPLSSKE
jgi:acetylornithine deacetylase/succinyl-diaminopimelate desuccinylase-like protein